MLGFFSSAPKAPRRVPGDLVVPVGFFDDTIIFRTFVLYTLFVFDDVLEPQKLRTSLEHVDRGEIEHHIPTIFSQDRPAVGFDHVSLDALAVEDHPGASCIPHPPLNDRPAIVGDPDNLSALIYSNRVPRTLDDYIYTDRPQLGLRVVSFKNSTIVVLHWIHLTFDATAKGTLLNAWMLMLQGRENEIPEPLSPHEYILEHCGKNPTEPHVLAEHHMSKFGLVWWLLQNSYNLMFKKQEHRVVCVPAAYLAKLREKALAELAAEASSEKCETPFLSKEIFSLIGCLDWQLLILQKIRRNLHLAAQIRRSIKEQGSREQVEAYTSLIRLDPANRAPPFFGSSSMQLLMFSNWQKANMYGTDLSAAAVTPRRTPLRPSYVQSVQGPYNFSDGIIIVGKDAEGNYWLSGNRAKGLWGMMGKKMEDEVI
ncbi:hypothetical protein TrVFT333_006503 [Trichoderma virens FT-333]|nr:hypothetical protein TrVFT333_006503 [Trichoderma virens FT-333]